MQGFDTTGSGTVASVHRMLDKVLLTLTSWRRVFLEKLTHFQPAKKFPAFYGIRKFVTAFKTSHRLSCILR
jgi:hypothetical protein